MEQKKQFLLKLYNLIKKNKSDSNIQFKSNNNEKFDLNKGIIEVANFNTYKINNPKEQIEIDWLDQLILPYKRKAMEDTELCEEILILYKKLCDFITEKLQEKNTTLLILNNHELKQNKVYNNLFYTIFCIAEGHITLNHNRYLYDYTFSYSILREYVGNDIVDDVFDFAESVVLTTSNNIYVDEVFENYSELEEEYNHYEGYYFPSEKDYIPYDPFAEIKQHLNLTDTEKDILDITNKRNNKVWKYFNFELQIITLYLYIFDSIEYDVFNENYKWKKRNLTNFQKFLNGEINSWDRYHYRNKSKQQLFKVMDSVLKLSENTIREIIPNIKTVNCENEQNIVNNYFPKEILQIIDDCFEQYKKSTTNEVIIPILEEIIEENRNDWKTIAEYVFLVDFEEQIKVMSKYFMNKNGEKMFKYIIKNSKDDNLTLASLYCLNVLCGLTRTNVKLLYSIILPENKSEYNRLVESAKIIDTNIFNKLKSLKEKQRKTITLDSEKIVKSEIDLQKTVKTVNSYIDLEEETKEKEVEIQTNSNNNVTNDTNNEFFDLINDVLNVSNLSLNNVKKYAMKHNLSPTLFINKINEDFFNIVNDSILVIENENVKIDDYYVDDVKEYINEHKGK